MVSCVNVEGFGSLRLPSNEGRNLTMPNPVIPLVAGLIERARRKGSGISQSGSYILGFRKVWGVPNPTLLHELGLSYSWFWAFGFLWRWCLGLSGLSSCLSLRVTGTKSSVYEGLFLRFRLRV